MREVERSEGEVEGARKELRVVEQEGSGAAGGRVVAGRNGGGIWELGGCAG